MAASPSFSSPAATATAPAPAPVVTFEDLDNSVRNGKKKLYWSAFEVVLVTAQGGGAPVETRYDAYQVNHNHLKKLHAGARGPHYVRVECKYCTAPRFTQSITVSTKKFEEHYMTLHALDALATADAKKAAQQLQQHQQQRKSGRVAVNMAVARGDGDDAMDDKHHEGEEEEDAADENGTRQRPKRTRKESGTSTPVAGAAKRTRRGALTKDEDDHVAAMQGAAAAVVALSGGASATPRAVESGSSSSAPSAHTAVKPTPNQQQQQGTALPSSLVDSSIVLDPADSDTKRAKKSYWTAYEVVICERVPRASEVDGEAATGVEMVTRETRQDAWRVNHNALRRLHLDPQSDTTVRVECRFCDEPKFNQSITVSTRKFEQHYYYEHGDESQRQELEERLAAKAAAEAAALTDAANGTSQDTSMFIPKRRKSWKALLMDRENAAAATYAAGGSTGKLPFGGVGGPLSRGIMSARHQRASLMNWLLHDYMPFSTVGSDHFQAFVAALDRKFELPQPTALRSELQQRFDLAGRAAKRQIEEELAAGTAFALAVDQFPVRTSAGDEVAHVSVTVHFISRDWERRQLVLACRAVGIAPPLKAVWAVVRGVLDEFGIPAAAIASVTARDVEDLSLAVEGVASLGESRERRASAKILCAAGALHDIVEAGTRVLRRDVVEFEPIHSLLKLEALEASTWTDLYASVNAIVLHHKSSATDAEKSQPAASLSPEAILTAQAVVELLDPFMRIAEEMSRAAYPTIPMIFQYFRHMKEIVAQHEARNDVLVPVIKAMQIALGELYDKVIHSKALIAYVLDPRFHFSHISSADETSIRSHIVTAIAALKGESEAAANNGVTEGRSEQQGDDSTGAPTTRQTRSLFEELATSGKRTSIGGASSAKPDGSGATASRQAGLDEYLGLDDEDFSVNVLQWWQAHEAQFPTLAQLARRVLAVVGTSLPAAELFSRDGQQLAARRSALSPSIVEATVVVRAMADPIEHTQPQPASTRVRAAPLATEPRRRASAANTPSPTSAAAVPPAPEVAPTAASEQGASDKDAVAVIV